MEKKRIQYRLPTLKERLNQPPVSLAEGLRQFALAGPLSKSGQARLEHEEKKEAKSKRKIKRV